MTLDVLEDAALRTLCLAGIVQCALWLLRVRQPRLLLTAWTVVLAVSIAMPMLPQFTPVRVPLDWAISSPLIDDAADLLQRAPPDAPWSDEVVGFPAQPSARSWLEAVYVVVASGILLRVLLGVALSFRLLARAVPIRPEWAAGHRLRISRAVTGPVTVGMRAGGNSPYSAPQQLRVVAGQKAAAQARFFHKADGTSWVRFSAFERPPLDLPVRLAQGRITWTGEYGIAYAVQAGSGNRLVGLAAPVANDSARLEFACTASFGVENSQGVSPT